MKSRDHVRSLGVARATADMSRTDRLSRSGLSRGSIRSRLKIPSGLRAAAKAAVSVGQTHPYRQIWAGFPALSATFSLTLGNSPVILKRLLRTRGVVIFVVPALLAFVLGASDVSLALNLVRTETGVDKVVAALGVSGEGVIVAILDRGINWENNDFRNEDGTTRIAYIFDLFDDSGADAPDNPMDGAPSLRGTRSTLRSSVVPDCRHRIPTVMGTRRPALPPGTGATAPTGSIGAWRPGPRSSRSSSGVSPAGGRVQRVCTPGWISWSTRRGNSGCPL